MFPPDFTFEDLLRAGLEVASLADDVSTDGTIGDCMIAIMQQRAALEVAARLVEIAAEVPSTFGAALAVVLVLVATSPVPVSFANLVDPTPWRVTATLSDEGRWTWETST